MTTSFPAAAQAVSVLVADEQTDGHLGLVVPADGAHVRLSSYVMPEPWQGRE
jgi:hypothetical protein